MNLNAVKTYTLNNSNAADRAIINEIINPSNKKISLENKSIQKVKTNRTTKNINPLIIAKIKNQFTKTKTTSWKNLPVKKIAKYKVVETKLELSYREISEQELIIEVPMKKIAWSNFSIQINDYSKNVKSMLSKNENKSDRISTIASANEKSNNRGFENNNNDVISHKEKSLKSADEIVFFDYSEDGNVTTKVVAESTPSIKPIESPKVNGISKISNLIGTTKNSKSKQSPLQDISFSSLVKKGKAPREKVDSQKPQDFPGNVAKGDIVKNNEGNSFLDNGEEPETKTEEDYACLDSNKLKRKSYKSDYLITLDSVDHVGTNFEKAHNFKISFLDDRDDEEFDGGTGEINLQYNLTSQMNIRRGTIFAHGHYPTTVDFVFEGESMAVPVPVFKTETLNRLIEDVGIRAQGAQLLIQLDDTTEDIDLSVETNFEAKLYLDNQLKVVTRDDANYSYVLFLGVDAGNTIIYFKNNKNEISNKIIHLASDEMYFEPNFYAEVLDDKVELYQENLLSKCKGLLNIKKEEITPWSFEGIIKKNSINKFSTNRMIYPLGTRRYFELSHLEESVFIGRWSENAVVVPGEDYIHHVLGNFDTIGNECLVQLNLTKKAKAIAFDALSSNGIMRPTVKYLDNDGIFYNDMSDESKRLFILGNEQGIINIKVDYTDGSSQFIQTFCSNNTYLVEQL